MSRWGNLAVLIGFFWLSSFATATTINVSRNARTFDFIDSSAIVKGVANACLGLLEISDSLPCNPAAVPFNTHPGLRVQGLLSNGYNTLEKAQRLVHGDLDATFLNSLFSGDSVIQIEGDANVAFYSKFLNVKWTPESVRMFGVAENEANPTVEIYATEEKTLILQTGFKITDNFSAGLQGRFIDRKVVKNSILLISLATQAGQNALQPKAQSAIYVEPGLEYIFEQKWKTRLSAMVQNLGYVSQTLDEVPLTPEFQWGVAVSPPIPYGSLDLLLDYKQLTYDEDPSSRFHAGALYKIGAMTTMAGIDVHGISGGFEFSVEQASAGILFTTTQFPSNSNSTYAQTVYVELGWQL